MSIKYNSPNHPIEIELEGVRESQARLLLQEQQMRHSVFDLVSDSTDFAHDQANIYAPIEKGNLRRRINKEATDFSRMSGRRTWTGKTGITATGSRYPLYVHEGTGIYRMGASSVQRITSNTPGKPLTFQKAGEPRRFKMHVKGQRPQPFMYMAWLATKVYMHGRIASMKSFGRLID